MDSIEGYAVFTMDIQGNISSWNHGAERLLGYSEQQIIGKNFDILFIKEDYEKGIPQKQLKDAQKKGKSTADCYYLMKDGSKFWASGLVFPLFDEQKNVRGFSKVLRDLTAQKKAQDLLIQVKEYTQSIVDTVREPVLILNKDFTIISANRSFYKNFKVKKRETADVLLYELGNGQWNIPVLKSLLEDILPNNGTCDNFEVEHVFPSLGKRIMLLNARKLYRAGNHTEMILLAIEDITERRALEQQKDDFISIASHELKTPVTSIKALAQLLSRQSNKFNDSHLLKSLERIDFQSNKLVKLIGYLLDVSKIQAGKLALEMEKFGLQELITEIIEEVQLTAYNHTIKLECNENTTVYADRYRVGQVISNLLTNAVKYSPNANLILVHIKQDKQKTQVQIEVQDYGIGIPKDEQVKIFKRFSRTSNVKEHKIEGVGLGLHISQEIINKHKGKIGFTSIKEKGSVFYFTLPLITANDKLYT